MRPTNTDIFRPDAAINYHGNTYPAVICPTCHGRIYPANALKAHLDHHAYVAKWGPEPGPLARRKMMQATRVVLFWYFMSLTSNGATHGPFASKEQCEWGRNFYVHKTSCWEVK